MAISFAATGSLTAAIAALIIVVLAALALGRCVQTLAVHMPVSSRPAAWERFVADGTSGLIRFALGFNLLGLVAVTLSLLGLGGSSVRASYVLGLACFELIGWVVGGLRSRSTAGTLSRPRELHERVWQGGRHSAAAVLKNHVALLLLGGLTLGSALVPPEGWDELVYHAELPQRWNQDETMAVYFDLPYSGFPSLGEAAVWLVAPIEHVIAPRLILWSTWMAGLVLLQICLNQIVSPLAAQALLSSLALCDTVLLISGCCYVEAVLMMNVATILLWIVHPDLLPRGSLRSTLAVAILSGGAASVKLTAATVGILPLLILSLRPIDTARTAVGERLGRIALYSLATLCFAFPFYLRPYLATGNPLFPFFEQWFTSEAARVESSHFHHAIAGQAFGVEGLAGKVMAPLLLAFDRDLFDGTFGYQLWMWLGLIAYGFRTSWARRRSGWQSLVLLASAIFLLASWSVTTQQARFAIPAAMCLLVLAAVELREMRPQAVRQRWYLAALMLCCLLSVPWGTATYYISGWMCGVGLVPSFVSTDEATGGEYLPLMAAIDENTPSDAHVLMLFEHRGFYLPRRHWLGTPFFQSRFFTPAEAYGSGALVAEALRTEGITHVVLSVALAGPDYAPAWAARLPSFLTGLEQAVSDGSLRLIWESGRYKIFQLSKSEPS